MNRLTKIGLFGFASMFVIEIVFIGLDLIINFGISRQIAAKISGFWILGALLFGIMAFIGSLMDEK